jgi:hypothetical protein
MGLLHKIIPLVVVVVAAAAAVVVQGRRFKCIQSLLETTFSGNQNFHTTRLPQLQEKNIKKSFLLLLLHIIRIRSIPVVQNCIWK